MAQRFVSTIRDLKRRRGRERRRLAVAEGVRLVEEALATGLRFRGAVTAPQLEGTPRGRQLKTALAESGVELEDVSDAELARLADTEHPQGVMAIIEPPEWTLGDIPRGTVVVLDGVQDPGNVGTIVRTAFALGAAGAIALPGTVDLTNPKVLRAGMGAGFRLPTVHAGDDAVLEWAKGRGAEVWAATTDGEPVWRCGRPGELLLLLGNEGAGVRSEWLARAARRVAIPQRPGAESLNVAVAAGILLYEVSRVG